MPLDPKAQEVIDEAAALGIPPPHTVSPQQARLNAQLRPRAPGPAVSDVKDLNIPSPRGEVPVRVYTPPGEGPFPVLMWFHGGGIVVGDLDAADGNSRNLCVGAGCVVVSVDYRLAPEHKFPAAPEDCYAATTWVVEQGASIDADPRRIVVGGDSAGGNLAAVVALMSRDRSGPTLSHQPMVYPMLDCDYDTPSYLQNADGFLLTRDSMIWFWNHYLRSDDDKADPYALPLQAEDLSGLPSALVITAEYDPLRNDGETYGGRLQKEGVPTTSVCYDGMLHGFFAMSAVLDQGKQAMAAASDELIKAFRGS